MRLNKLRPIHDEILEKFQTYAIFQFKKNKTEFDVFYDIVKMPWQLGLLARQENFQLWIAVDIDFNFIPYIDPEQYKKLVAILGIKYDPNNKFTPFAFFKEFNESIPSHLPNIDHNSVRKVVLKCMQIEEADKIYYCGSIEWDKLGGSKKRSIENLEKTRLLYPELYFRIKDRNISVKYSALKRDELQTDPI